MLDVCRLSESQLPRLDESYNEREQKARCGAKFLQMCWIIDYIPSQPALETLPATSQLSANAYGGMPIQIGWCNVPLYLWSSHIVFAKRRNKYIIK